MENINEVLEEAALGKRLDPEGLNHNDDSLMELAARVAGAGHKALADQIKYHALRINSAYAQTQKSRDDAKPKWCDVTFIKSGGFGDVMVMAVWNDCVAAGAFIRDDGDGDGYYAKKVGEDIMVSPIDAFGPRPDWATHVVWYNK